MRILWASLFATTVVIACGSAPKKEGALVNEGSDTAPTCCCKTIPVTDDKEITPQYAMAVRMECSTSNGECVDDVQCNGAKTDGNAPATKSTDVPPPPTISPNNNAPIQ